MSEAKLLALFDCVYLVSLATWIGSLAFWLFAVTPVLKRRLAVSDFGAAEHDIGQRCCIWGAVGGATALATVVYGATMAATLEADRAIAVGLLILSATAAMAYVAGRVFPQLARFAAEADMPAEGHDRLRQVGHTLLSLALVIGLGLLTAHAFRDSIWPKAPVKTAEMHAKYLRVSQAYMAGGETISAIYRSHTALPVNANQGSQSDQYRTAIANLAQEDSPPRVQVER